MPQLWRFQPRTHYVGLFLIAVLILNTFPARLAQAALVNQPLDDTLTEFTSGSFQRIALSSLQAPTNDQVGAIQLARSGLLKPWKSLALILPQKLTDPGAVALGRRIYVIGGSSSDGGSNTNSVYWTDIDPDNGTSINGQPLRNDDPLPAIQANNFVGVDAICTAPVAERSAAAVAAWSTGGNGGYIYVAGGSVKPSGCITVSSYAVQVGKVDATTGRISWSAGPSLPKDELGNQDGLEYARAITIDTGAKTFLYVIGGTKRYLEFTGKQTATEISKKVYYTEVNRTTGALQSWQVAADLPTTLSKVALVGGYFAGNGSNGGYAFYLTGGEKGTSGDLYNTTVYRAIVDPSTGTLTWNADIGPPGKEKVVLQEPRVGMSAVTLNGKLYLIGGKQPTNDTFQRSVLTTYVQDDLSLPNLGSAVEQVFFNDSPNIIDERSNHASVVIPATPKPDEPSAAWVYVIGGSNGEGATDRIYYGKIGGADESDENKLTPTGWYYSEPFSIQINNKDTEIQEINWTTTFNRSGNTDIEISYRVAAVAGLCTDPNTFSGKSWVALDGSTADAFYSVNGKNTVVLDGATKPPPSSCLQYRAQLITDNPTTSPSLLNISVKKVVPGSPDLKPYALNPSRDGQNKLNGLMVKIINNNEFESPTQPADYENPGRGGSFFVDLCVSAVNSTITPPSSKEGKDPECSKAYTNINKGFLGAGAIYEIPLSSWRATTAPYSSIDPLTFFSGVGTYEVLISIDAQRNVNEGEGQANTNNVSEKITITIQEGEQPDPTRRTFLPLIRR